MNCVFLVLHPPKARQFDLCGIPIHTETQQFPLQQANEALLALKTGKINGAGVLQIS
jgi:hypothetical protein